MKSRQNKIVILGGITWRNTNHPHLGGTTVLMDNFIDYCEEHNIPHAVVPTNRFYGHCSSIINMVLALYGFLRKSRRGDVIMINISSDKGMITLFPLITFLSKLKGNEVVCRKFAGSFHKNLEGRNIKKKIVLFLLRKTKVSFFETEAILSWLEKEGYKGVWFPNVRKNNTYQVPEKYDKRLVFIAQIFEDKGVDELLRVSNEIPDGYIIDLYGPIKDEKYTQAYFAGYKATYKGVLAPEEVVKTLSKYNLMVFPTWWHSEGYPGVIIEAFSIGMPVISTKVGGIPEMIVNNECGLLVEDRDEVSLRAAILSIDQNRYDELKEGSIKRFEQYDSEIVNKRVVDLMLGKNTPPRPYK